MDKRFLRKRLRKAQDRIRYEQRALKVWTENYYEQSRECERLEAEVKELLTQRSGTRCVLLATIRNLIEVLNEGNSQSLFKWALVLETVDKNSHDQED